MKMLVKGEMVMVFDIKMLFKGIDQWEMRRVDSGTIRWVLL